MTHCGIICKIYNSIYTVLDITTKKELLCLKKNSTPNLIIGDKVDFDLDSDRGIITNIQERNNIINKPLLTNIDKMIFVVAISEPDYSSYIVDSFLAYYSYLGITPIVIFNKTDISSKTKQEKLKIYQKLGYECYFISALELTDKDRAQLIKIISNKTIAFAGVSGVGKSTLVNQLFGEGFVKTGLVSEKLKRGKQTTKQSMLYFYEPSNTFIADTPGYSMIDIKTLQDSNLYEFFPEFAELIGQCKFDNCKHLAEPKCAIKDALVKGDISQSRYDSYLKLSENISKLRPTYNR